MASGGETEAPESSAGGANNSSASPSSPSSASGTGSTPDNPVNATIRQYRQQNLGYANLSSDDQSQFRGILQDINNTDSEQGRFALINEIEKRIDWPNDKAQQRRQAVRANFNTGTDPNSTPADPVNTTIREFRQQNLGYANLSSDNQSQFRGRLQELNGSLVRNPDRITREQQRILSDIIRIFPNDGNQQQRRTIVKENFGFAENMTGQGYSDAGPNLDIPSIMDVQLNSLADSFKEAAADTLGTIYNLAFSTPVPENDGWRGIFGEPTNATGSPQNATNGTSATNATGAGQNATNATNASDSWGQVLGISSDRAFQQLHQQLLMDRLYPLLNYVLGIAVVVLGLSLTVNPFMSRFRIINLMVKFVTFLFLYAFSWGAITLMHGVVNEITMWLRPSSAELESLLTSFDTLGAGAAAAYFAGAGGIFTTVLGMGLELAVRHLALVYFLPYVFPVLILILYLSPWQRLKQFASMGIWQYVNVLTMVIPMAAFLKAALIVDFSPTDGIGGMIVLLALFILAVVFPLIQTYFFIQIPGTAAWAAKTAGSAVASRVGAAKEKVWGSDDSSADSTATGNTNPGDRAEAAVEASASSRPSMSSSGKLSSESVERMDPAGNSETTAGQIRALDEEQHRDPNNADAKYEAYVEKADSSGPNRTTMQHKLAD